MHIQEPLESFEMSMTCPNFRTAATHKWAKINHTVYMFNFRTHICKLECLNTHFGPQTTVIWAANKTD